MHTLTLVRQFHKAFGHPASDVITTPDAKTRLLRFRLLLEEVMEFGRAIGVAPLAGIPEEEFLEKLRSTMDAFTIDEGLAVDLVEAADALGDIDYVAQGANLVFGFPAIAVVAEIHRANMSKLGADGKPILDERGKVVKGPNYRKPDVAAVLAEFAESLAIGEERKIWGPRP
jgi:predicted HAD superfamily Cof-like phosphohydrolase